MSKFLIIAGGLLGVFFIVGYSLYWYLGIKREEIERDREKEDREEARIEALVHEASGDAELDALLEER